MFINRMIITHNIAVTDTVSEILGKEPHRKKTNCTGYDTTNVLVSTRK